MQFLENSLWKVAMLFALLAFPSFANATWQPEEGFAPSPAVAAWFKAHAYCCLRAERVRTKFRVSAVDGKDEWQYLDGTKWTTLHPAYGVEDDGVVPPKGFEQALQSDQQFQQLRAEGVLFVYNGSPFCFFVPRSGG
jgi:hypothetical protein